MDEPRTEPPRAEPPPTWEDFVRENGERARAGAAGGPGARGAIPDFTPLIAIVEALRRAIPHELQEQFNALQRELLLTLRALIDWYLDRLDKPELTPQVEDIPIE
jgi:hypothetical protein